MEIRVHVLEDHIDIFVIIWFNNSDEFDDIFVIDKLTKVDNLTVGSLSISWILESIKNLQEN